MRRDKNMDKKQEIQDEVQLIQDLFDGIDNGDFNNFGETSDKYTFKYLKAIWDLQTVLVEEKNYISRYTKLQLNVVYAMCSRNIKQEGKSK